MEPRCESFARGTSTDSRVAPASRAPQHSTNFGNRGSDGDDHHALKHVHHLLWNECVDGESTLRERRKEKSRKQNAERMVSANERDGDAEESSAAREAVFV